jgi:hypothetical protein
MIDDQCSYTKADPDSALYDVGGEVEERRQDIACTENDFGNDQYDGYYRQSDFNSDHSVSSSALNLNIDAL